MYAVILMVLLLVLLWSQIDGGEQVTELQQFRLNTWLNVSHHESQELISSSIEVPITELNFTGVHTAPGNASILNPFIPAALDAEITKIWATTPQESVYYHNISSVLQGRYIQGTMEPKEHMDTKKYNLTIEPRPVKLESSGSLSLYMMESLEHGRAGYVQGTAYFADSQADLYGFNLGHGKVALTTKSLKFSGLKALPFLLPSSEEIVTPGAHDAKALLQDMIKNDTTEYTYQQFDSRIESTARCEWVLYGYLHRAHISLEEMEEVEKELENPMGRPIPPIPRVKFSGVMYSPDCGLTMTINVDGERSKKYVSRLRHALVLLLVLYVVTYGITILQVQRINTPTATYRVSFWSIATNVLVDGTVLMMCVLATHDKEIALQTFAILAIVYCFAATVQLDFMISIFQSQLGEGTSPTDMTYNQISAMINSRLYFAIFSLSMLILMGYVISDYKRRILEWVILLCLYSNWWPQVYRNARRGFSRPFSLKFIYSTSVLRLAPFMYMCFYPRNVAFHPYDSNLGYTLLGWQWFQVMMLTAQYYLGGQFFVPKGFVVDGYDYHPILTDDLEAALHTSELPMEEGGDGTKKVDCPICMNSVTLVTTSASSSSTVLLRRAYMVTPCNHVFHTECLEEWMLRKLECPVCRSKLPPT